MIDSPDHERFINHNHQHRRPNHGNHIQNHQKDRHQENHGKSTGQGQADNPDAKSGGTGNRDSPSVTTVLVEMVADAFPNVPSGETLLDTLTKRGLHASQSTVKTVREHTKRALNVLAILGRLKTK